MGEKKTPLHYAACNDACHSLRMLIKKGASVHPLDYKGRTPLQAAAELGELVHINLISFAVRLESMASLHRAVPVQMYFHFPDSLQIFFRVIISVIFWKIAKTRIQWKGNELTILC